MEDMIKNARKEADDEKAKPGLWNPESYKVASQNYNSSDLQRFFPSMFLIKRTFATLLYVQFENAQIDFGNTKVYSLLREQNRLDPIKLLRRDSFKTKLWLENNLKGKKTGFVDTAYERLKRAVDDEDTQCLLLSRQEARVDRTQVKVVKRMLTEIVECVDNLIELAPEDERAAARAIADTKTVQVLKLPFTEKFKNKTYDPSVSKTFEAPAEDKDGKLIRPAAPAAAPAAAPVALPSNATTANSNATSANATEPTKSA